jgi:hypothetical protein
MKKIILSFIVVITLVVTITSCTKDCYSCTTSGDEENICREDFASEKEYTTELKKLRALGFNCK